MSENQILFNIPDADSINHIVVFMTGQVPFPDGLGGAGKYSKVQFFLIMPVTSDIVEVKINVYKTY